MILKLRMKEAWVWRNQYVIQIKHQKGDVVVDEKKAGKAEDTIAI